MAHVERRGQGRWRARYRGPDGRERSKTFDRRSDADRWLASIEVSRARGEWVDPTLGRRTFASWAEEWSQSIVDLRPSTLNRDLGVVRVHLLPRFGSVPLARLTHSMVRGFVADMLATGAHSPATVRKVGQILSKIMRGAVEAGLIARSPCEGLRLPAEPRREMRFLTADQVATLAEAAAPEATTLIYTAAYAGLRWGELAGLRVARVNLLRRTIVVVEQLNELAGKLSWGPPKTAAGRRAVSIPGALAQMLEVQLTRPEVIRSGLVFPTPLGEAMRRSNFARRVWAPAVGRVGLDGLRFHDLRHTAVALAISQGAHPKALQERMGHSSVTVTLDRYGHLYQGLDGQIADALDDVLRNSRGLAAACTPSADPALVPSEGESAGQTGWALRDSNPRPPPCKGGALAC
jgi:integrase